MGPTATALRKEKPAPSLSPEQAATMGTEFEASTRLLVAARHAFTLVQNDSDVQQAVLDRKDIAERVAKVAGFFKPFKEMAHRLHRTLCDRENEILAPLLKLDQQLKFAMMAYTTEQAAIRRAEEARLAEERRQAEQQRLLEEAAALERQGETQLAEAVIFEAEHAPTPVVTLPSTKQTVPGFKTRRVWKWRPLGGDLPRALALVPREYLTLDVAKLDGYARSMKDTAKVPGVEFYYEDVPVR